jgi:P27 family predicted phage terminase small subunit
MMGNNGLKAPKHLRKGTKQFWLQVVRDFALETYHVRLLTHACEAWDRVEQAREAVAKDGAYFIDRFGQRKAHPGLLVERDNRTQFAKLIRELNLDVDSPTEEYSRPPALVK